MIINIFVFFERHIMWRKKILTHRLHVIQKHYKKENNRIIVGLPTWKQVRKRENKVNREQSIKFMSCSSAHARCCGDLSGKMCTL